MGVGSNQDDPRRQVERALLALQTLGAVRASSLYRSEPLGDPAQPWYVNAVAELRTALAPRDLLEALRELECAAGRPAERERWAPRILDLDLLLYDAVRIDEPGLVVPHPGLAQRRFVLVPLAEIAPEALDPRCGRSAQELLAALDDPLRLEKLPAREGPR